MEEVEIISPAKELGRDIAKLTITKEVQVPIQTIIVNNQEKIVMGKACVMVCPVCGNVIKQFNPGVPIVEVLQYFTAKNEEELKATIHCSKCGQKLRFMRDAPVDVEFKIEETKAEENKLENNLEKQC